MSDKLKTKKKESNQEQPEAEVMISGGELYYYLKNFLQERLKQLADVSDDCKVNRDSAGALHCFGGFRFVEDHHAEGFRRSRMQRIWRAKTSFDLTPRIGKSINFSAESSVDCSRRWITIGFSVSISTASRVYSIFTRYALRTNQLLWKGETATNTYFVDNDANLARFLLQRKQPITGADLSQANPRPPRR